MNPVAFEIFGLQIRWYGIIIAGGVLAAFLLSSVLAKKKGVSFDDIVDAFISKLIPITTMNNVLNRIGNDWVDTKEDIY